MQPATILFLLWVLSSLSFPALSQDPPAEAAKPAEATPAPTSKDQVYVNPMVGSIAPRTGSWTPLTPEQRWNIYVRENYMTPGAGFRALGSALGDHLGKRPDGWKLGAEGYALRASSRFARFTLEGTMEAASAYALGYDVRYIPCRCSGFFKRTGHAFLWNFVTLDRNGKKVLNVPRIVSSYGSEMIATSWLPEGSNSLSAAVRNANSQFYFGTFANILREFGPEIKRVFKKKK